MLLAKLVQQTALAFLATPGIAPPQPLELLDSIQGSSHFHSQVFGVFYFEATRQLIISLIFIHQDAL
jgi:hypothetical protein